MGDLWIQYYCTGASSAHCIHMPVVSPFFITLSGRGEIQGFLLIRRLLIPSFFKIWAPYLKLRFLKIPKYECNSTCWDTNCFTERLVKILSRKIPLKRVLITLNILWESVVCTSRHLTNFLLSEKLYWLASSVIQIFYYIFMQKRRNCLLLDKGIYCDYLENSLNDQTYSAFPNSCPASTEIFFLHGSQPLLSISLGHVWLELK